MPPAAAVWGMETKDPVFVFVETVAEGNADGVAIF